MRSEERRSNIGSISCMRSVLRLFDFHQFQCFNQQKEPAKDPLIDPISTKGIEAPRNCLEEEDNRATSTIGHSSSSSSFSGSKGHEDDDVESYIQLRPVKPSPSRPCHQQSSSDEDADKSLQCLSMENRGGVSSPGSKTPNLVARLMGLDLLPEDISSANSSPVFRKPSSRYRHMMVSGGRRSLERGVRHVSYDSGTRSMPDTPRISSASRKSDVDARHSFQLNKENINGSEFCSAVLSKLAAASSSSPISCKKSKGNSKVLINSCHHILAKENVAKVNNSRKFGDDLTNIRSNANTEKIGKQLLVHSNNSCSLHKMEDQRGRWSKPRPSSRSKTSRSYRYYRYKCSTTHRSHQQPPLPPATKCKKGAYERFTKKPKISLPPLQTIQSSREPILAQPVFINNKAILSIPTLPSMAKGEVASMVSTSNCYPGLVRTYGRVSGHDVREGRAVCPEFFYIREILEGTGVHTRLPVPVSPAIWHSPSHPLNQSLFHSLELSSRSECSHYSGLIRTRAYRLLIFHLVNDLLANQLHFNAREPLGVHPSGPQIMDIIWTGIRSFSTMKIQTTRDIDEVIGSSLGETDRCGSEEERDMVATEIEREMLNMLVEEAVLGLNGSVG